MRMESTGKIRNRRGNSALGLQCFAGDVKNIPKHTFRFQPLMRPSSPCPVGTNGIASFRSSSKDSMDTTPPVNGSKFPSECGAEHPFFKAKQEITTENPLSRTEPTPPERQQSQLVIGGSGASTQCEVSEAEKYTNSSGGGGCYATVGWNPYFSRSFFFSWCRWRGRMRTRESAHVVGKNILTLA